MTLIRKYRALRTSVILLAVWYVPLTAFAAFYPYCHGGEDAVCYIGVTDYGALYDALWWLSFFWAIPFVASIFGAFIYAVCSWCARVRITGVVQPLNSGVGKMPRPQQRTVPC